MSLAACDYEHETEKYCLAVHKGMLSSTTPGESPTSQHAERKNTQSSIGVLKCPGE